jgi:uncharacterized membrane protein
MGVGHLSYLPLAPLFFAMLGGVLLALVALVEVGVLRYAYLRIGASPRVATALLFGSLLGSYVNIPVYQLPEEELRSGEEITFYGVQYEVPVLVDWPGTIVAVNVGGAVIPALLSLYLLSANRLWVRGSLAALAVATICHLVAQPVPGVGIAEPIFVPPLAAAVASVLLSPSYSAPLAYISGSLGALIGADLLNLDKIRGLGAPVASIGGAGTFDGIFLAGILAVLLAGITGRPQVKRR